MKTIRDKELYLQNVSPELPLYYQGWFLDATSENWEALIHLSDGKIKWMWAYEKSSKYGVSIYSTPLFAHENCPVVFDNNYFENHNFQPLPFLAYTSISDRRNVLKKLKGWRTEERYRQYFDLNSYPTDYADIKKNKRYKIRKSSATIVQKDADLKRFQELHKSSYKRRDREALSYKKQNEIFSKIADHTTQHLFILLNDDGIPVAGQWVVGYGRTLYAINRAKNYSVKSKGVQEYLMWQVIQELRKDYDIFDLGGSSIDGVRKFNIDMGATDIPYKKYYTFRPSFLNSYFTIK